MYCIISGIYIFVDYVIVNSCVNTWFCFCSSTCCITLGPTFSNIVKLFSFDVGSTHSLSLQIEPG